MTDQLPEWVGKSPSFIQNAWNEAHFTQFTHIQDQAIPRIEEGKDILAQAPAGSGKTLAYVLPILHGIQSDRPQAQAVILASSHELVMQILDVVQTWSKNSDIRAASFIGGTNVKRQLDKLKKKPHIIVGTPGRVHELIQLKKLKMHEVKTIVLDEGDQLLTKEHVPTVKAIVSSTLADRQVVLFSATLAEAAIAQAQTLMKEPSVLSVKHEALKPQNEYIYFAAERRDYIDVVRKLAQLKGIRAIVFLHQIGDVDMFKQKLSFKGIPCDALHSEADKQERAKAIQQLRSGKSALLLTTDVAARGIDIPDLTHVIQVGLPKDKEQYIHRAGRTGRVGANAGTVVSIVNEYDVPRLKKLTAPLGQEPTRKQWWKGEIKDVEEGRTTGEHPRGRKQSK
ncbi:DEAD/DEAH box helicase [Aureibacillus halotolerans]|uniref:Superfamily II DNA/RNA helicase n=1 Tax=Aureibacillus halotolerans TaxID=1508390 RepID=A0A4R6UCI5_9BACI|nr:DEAD/DEAH box helicase [Aureibacillus halotolerans]TDQ42823.1 superfamily II DNA/RNA helicase [Aureibacillus halotolerans]